MKKLNLRKFLQYVFLIVTLVIIFMLVVGRLKMAHAFCPYAGVCFGGMLLNPKFSTVLFPAAMIVGFLIAISATFVGRAFCGYICPVGTLQELLYNLNPSRKYAISQRTHRKLSLLKYVVFLFTLISAVLIIQFIYMGFCPVLALAHPANIGVRATVTLLIIFGAGLFIERFWCRYICPYAALMNMVHYIGRKFNLICYKIIIDVNDCVDCGQCTRHCPMHIEIYAKQEIDDLNCIRCRRCLLNCPKNKKI